MLIGSRYMAGVTRRNITTPGSSLRLFPEAVIDPRFGALRQTVWVKDQLAQDPSGTLFPTSLTAGTRNLWIGTGGLSEGVYIGATLDLIGQKLARELTAIKGFIGKDVEIIDLQGVVLGRAAELDGFTLNAAELVVYRQSRRSVGNHGDAFDQIQTAAEIAADSELQWGWSTILQFQRGTTVTSYPDFWPTRQPSLNSAFIPADTQPGPQQIRILEETDATVVGPSVPYCTELLLEKLEVSPATLPPVPAKLRLRTGASTDNLISVFQESNALPGREAATGVVSLPNNLPTDLDGSWIVDSRVWTLGEAELLQGANYRVTLERETG